MKKIIFTILILGSIFTSCSDIEVDTPSFEAKLDVLNYKVGDTVKFSFTGNADYIYLFSGELGKEYSKRSVYENAENGNAAFSFNSNVNFGKVGINNLSVLVSSDFNGIYDAINVKNATWIDITDKVALGTSSTNVASGTVNLVPYQVADKPLFIAYRYLGQDTQNFKQRTWTVGLFNFRTTHPDGEVFTNAATFSDAVFTNVDFNGEAASWTVNSTTLTHLGLDAGNTDDDDWAISKPINLKSATGDATGVNTIRTLNTGFTPTSYYYVYTNPGTFKATVVAVNATSEGRKEKIKEFVLVVE